MCLSFSLALAVGSPITIILSEEKEKYNLQTLLLSGVKGSEYILSTMFLPFLLTFVIMGTTPLILGVTIVHTFNYITIVLLTSLSIILFYLIDRFNREEPSSSSGYQSSCYDFSCFLIDAIWFG